MLPLMLVPLLVWVGVWAYLRLLDGKVQKLQQDMARLEAMPAEDEEL